MKGRRVMRPRSRPMPTDMKNRPRNRPLNGSMSASNSWRNSEFANSIPAMKAPSAMEMPTHSITSDVPVTISRAMAVNSSRTRVRAMIRRAGRNR